MSRPSPTPKRTSAAASERTASAGIPVQLPKNYQEIVNEIARFANIPRAEIERRVWMQALDPGSNVLEDVARFGVTPFEYDHRMERLYREGSGFIFETMVAWAKPLRQCGVSETLARIRRYTRRTAKAAKDVDVLILGDGVGNDSLLLALHGYRVHYFDVPGSLTYEFAIKRFQHYGMLNERILPVPDYPSCLKREYDVIVCFDVLEHLVDPATTIRDFSSVLKFGGIALISEDFGDLAAHLPTHLRSSAKFDGITPFLFLRNCMALSWYSPAQFKRMEFERVERVSWKHYWRLWKDYQVRGAYLHRFLSPLTRKLDKLPYLGG